jgi:hypothetical protein
LEGRDSPEFRVLEQLAAVDKKYSLHLPKVAATDEDLRSLRTLFPFEWYASYLAILRDANGWTNFNLSNSLFGTRDYAANESFRAVKQCAELMLPMKSSRFDFVRTAENCIPIGGDQGNQTVLVIERKVRARVGWLDGGGKWMHMNALRSFSSPFGTITFFG